MDFAGGIATDINDARDFARAMNCACGRHGILLTPQLAELAECGCAGRRFQWPVDSSMYGDILPDRWNLYALGEFDLDCVQSLILRDPVTLGNRYHAFGIAPIPDWWVSSKSKKYRTSPWNKYTYAPTTGKCISEDSVSTRVCPKSSLHFPRRWPLHTHRNHT